MSEIAAGNLNSGLMGMWEFKGLSDPEGDMLVTFTEYTGLLYPLSDDTYRIVGIEQLNTPAGSFDCTVLEAADYDGVRKKLWMINDSPGIYAKIIEEDPDENFGHYWIYELQEIK